jgi:hypothetical protein
MKYSKNIGRIRYRLYSSSNSSNDVGSKKKKTKKSSNDVTFLGNKNARRLDQAPNPFTKSIYFFILKNFLTTLIIFLVIFPKN